MDPDDFVAHLADFLILDSDHQHSLTLIYQSFRQALLQTSLVSDVVLSGSLSRGTTLALWTGHEPDIDIVLALKEERTLHIKDQIEQNDPWLVEKRVIEILHSVPGISNITWLNPFICFDYYGVSFDCLISITSNPSSGVAFVFPVSKRDRLKRIWHRIRKPPAPKHSKYVNPSLHPGGRSKTKGVFDDTAIQMSDPLKYNRVLDQFSANCQNAWQLLILLWKFHAFIHRSRVTSHMIDENVFGALANPYWMKSGPITLLQIFSDLLNYDFVWDDAELRGDRAFRMMRKGITRAYSQFSIGDNRRSLKTLEKTFCVNLTRTQNGIGLRLTKGRKK